MKKIFAVLLLSPVALFAETVDISPVVGISLQYGGDALGTIFYDDGTEQDLLAGQGAGLYAGVIADYAPYAVKATLGYKYATSMATNMTVAKTTLPLVVTGRYKLPKGFFLGAGLTLHLNPKLEIDSDVVEYEASPGYHAEFGWKFISAGFTSMTYSAGNADFSASSFDINLEYAF